MNPNRAKLISSISLVALLALLGGSAHAAVCVQERVCEPFTCWCR